MRAYPIAFIRIERQIDSQAREVDRTKNRWSTRTALMAGIPALRLTELARARKGDAYLSCPPGRPHGGQRRLREDFMARLRDEGVAIHLFKNLRKTWQTNARWILRMPPWVVEPMMGHVGTGVTGRHYDKPSDQMLAQALADAWRKHPFGDTYPWLSERCTRDRSR